MPAVLAVVSFLCTVICFIPFPWHYRTRNIPTMMNMIWIGQGNFLRGISAIIWNGSVVKKSLVFCDIGMNCHPSIQHSSCTKRYHSSSAPNSEHMGNVSVCVVYYAPSREHLEPSLFVLRSQRPKKPQDVRDLYVYHCSFHLRSHS